MTVAVSIKLKTAAIGGKMLEIKRRTVVIREKMFATEKKIIATGKKTGAIEKKIEWIENIKTLVPVKAKKKRLVKRPLFSFATQCYHPSIYAKISGATMVASLSIMYFGVLMSSFPQVIFSLGTAPEYDPKDVVESDIWQK